MSTTLTCTPPSEIVAGCGGCGSTTQLIAALVYALSQESEYDLPTDLAALLSDSACYTCLGDKQMLESLLNIFITRYLSDANAKEAIRDIACIACAKEKQVRAAFLYLICQQFMKPYILDSGVATLVGGAAIVTSTYADANNPIVLGYYYASGGVGTLAYTNVFAGTSFQINSTDGADTNKVAWAIIKGV